ncbi:major capsid protein [Azospirillum sp. B506]|uniref:major capsid protein n=1 Tax=Azospirillum sp. B506 TaxID=137721 RepID=UPI00034C7FFB|nr:major capsid protein [Azospirillum sp. B506]
MDIYSTLAMLGVLQSLRAKAPRFLLSMFFPLASFSDDEKIIFDVEVDDIEIAPFVSPLAAGRVGADTGYERSGQPVALAKLLFFSPNSFARLLACSAKDCSDPANALGQHDAGVVPD